MEKIAGTINVVHDNLAAAKLSAGHFLERAYNNFGYFGLKNSYWSEERITFLDEILKDQGMGPIFRLELEIDPSSNWLCELQRRYFDREVSWLKSLPKPVAVICCNDLFASCIVKACQASDIKVPDEVAVLGADN
ncbi:MAG: substrate-binding domain-containing protein, partial [Planctomycetota bacterium]